MNEWEAAAWQGAQQSVQTGMGIALQSRGIKQQIKGQKQIMDIQNKNAREMADFNQKKQMELWEATNYKAQIEQMKKAGLNPGLQYGMGGGGGSTTNAAQAQPGGGSNISLPPIDQLGIMMATSQKNLIDAQAKNLNAQTKKISEIDTTKTEAEVNQINQNIENLKQTIQSDKAKQYLTEAQTASQNIQNAFANKTFDDGVQIVTNNAKLGIQNIRKATIEGNIAEKTEEDQIAAIHSQAIGEILKNSLTIAQTNQTTTQTQNIITSTVQAWTQIGLTKRGLDQKDQEILINKFKTSMENGGLTPDSPEWQKSLQAFNNYLKGMK